MHTPLWLADFHALRGMVTIGPSPDSDTDRAESRFRITQ
jgi:hypothetical protein